jgi:hypothetical protein
MLEGNRICANLPFFSVNMYASTWICTKLADLPQDEKARGRVNTLEI